MGFKIAYSFIATDKFSEVGRRMEATSKRINAKMDKLNKTLERTRKMADRVGKSIKDVGKGMTASLSAPIALMGGLAVRAAAKMEVLTLQFETMLKSGEKATGLVNQLREFAKKTPFQLENIGLATKQLLGFGTELNNVLPTLKILGDISAGSGKSLTELTVIFGKIKGKGKAGMEEINQLAEAGIPIVAELAKKFNVSEKAIFEASSAGQLTFPVILETMKGMTKEGGLFNNMMGRLSTTTAGKFSTFKDSLNDALISIGDQVVTTFDLNNNLTKITDKINSLVAAFGKWTKENPRLAKMVFIGIAIAAVLGPILIIIGQLVIAVTALMPVFAALGGVIAAAFSPVGLIIAGIIATIFAVKKFVDFMKGKSPDGDFEPSGAGRRRRRKQGTTQAAEAMAGEKSETEVTVKLEGAPATVSKTRSRGRNRVNIRNKTGSNMPTGQ